MRSAYPTQDVCPTAVSLNIPCPTFIAVFGGASEPFAFPSPTPRAGQPDALQPVDMAGQIQIISWSPDGKWLAYWASTPDEVNSAQNNPSTGQPSAALAFYGVAAGKTCRMEKITNQGGAAQAEWTAQSEVIVSSQADGAFRGRPCAEESFRELGLLEGTPPPNSAGTLPALTAAPSAYPEVSFGGQYRAETRQVDSQGGILTFETRLVPSKGGLAVVEKTWHIDERLGGYEDFLGGEWISPGEFLIYETVEEGPLILDEHGNVFSVLKDLFHVQEAPPSLEQDGYTLAAAAIPGDSPSGGTESGNYHLLVYGVGNEAEFPEVRLYHSEYDLVETLPFRYFHAVSPNDNWLLMDLRPTIDGYGASAIYFRPLELFDGDWSLLAYGQDGISWTESWSEMAYSSGDVLTWQDFPDLNLLGRWQIKGYSAMPAAFSPDTCRLAVVGNRPEAPGDEQSLFVVDKCR